jgi:RNA polymerase primary sigma factor
MGVEISSRPRRASARCCRNVAPQMWSGTGLLCRRTRRMGDMTTPHTILTSEEEVALASAIEAGVLAEAALGQADASDVGDLALLVTLGAQAFTTFVTANLRLVWHEVHATGRRGAHAEELYQQGCLALVVAARRFDHTRGQRFAAIAVPYVRFALRDWIALGESAGDLTGRRARDVRHVRMAARHCPSDLSSQEVTMVLARQLGRPVRWIEEALRQTPAVSFDETLMHPSLGDDAPEVEELLERLTCEQREVLRLRYGLDGAPALSQAAVARQLRRCEASVRRIERAAFASLRGREAMASA